MSYAAFLEQQKREHAAYHRSRLARREEQIESLIDLLTTQSEELASDGLGGFVAEFVPLATAQLRVVLATLQRAREALA